VCPRSCPSTSSVYLLVQSNDLPSPSVCISPLPFLLQYSFVTLIVSIRRDQPPVGRTLFSLQCLNARRARNNVLFCLHLLRIYTVAYFHLDQTPSDRKKILRLNPNAACARHTSEKTATERLPGRAEKQLTPLRSADEMTNERAQQVRDHVTQTT